MGVVTDVTVKGLTTAVTNISATGMSDTTGQAIVNKLTALVNAVKPDASDIPYDSNLSVKGKIDEVNNKFLWEEREFNITYTSSTNPVATANVDISKSGYTPIGVISWGVFGTSSTLCIVTSLQVNPDNSTLYYAIRVRDNGTYSHFIRARVLYLKN